MNSSSIFDSYYFGFNFFEFYIKFLAYACVVTYAVVNLTIYNMRRFNHIHKTLNKNFMSNALFILGGVVVSFVSYVYYTNMFDWTVAASIFNSIGDFIHCLSLVLSFVLVWTGLLFSFVFSLYTFLIPNETLKESRCILP